LNQGEVKKYFLFIDLLRRIHMTQYSKIMQYLRRGGKLTASYARDGLGITNPSARVAELRAQGHVIYTNRRKNSENFYSTGRPSKSLVRLAYAAGGRYAFDRV
jgi:hypothetical protein